MNIRIQKQFLSKKIIALRRLDYALHYSTYSTNTQYFLPGREREGCRLDPNTEPQIVRCIQKHCVKQKRKNLESCEMVFM